MKPRTALTSVAHYTAPLRRFGASWLGRLLVLVIGMAAMTAMTIPDVYGPAGVSLSICLWCCLAYFAVEGFVNAQRAARAGGVRSYPVSPSGIVDLLAVLPVPIALACGSVYQTLPSGPTTIDCP